MDSRVEEDEDPDGCRHVAHTSPHGHHSTGVVVSLECRAVFALGKDNQGINNLVELADVKDPTVECQPLVPNSAPVIWAGRINSIRSTGTQRWFPDSSSLVVIDTIFQTGSSVDLADTVNSTGPAIGSNRAHNRVPEGIQHA